MEFGNSGIHGTLTDYPFLIVENKDTGNVARICIYYAYSQNTGTELNAEAINLNYLLINSALKNIGQQELANVISTIKNKVSSANNDDVPVKGIEYGTMNGSKNSYGNLKGVYLMFGTTMDSLYEEKEDVEQQEGNEEINDDKTSTNKQENSNNNNSEDKQTSNSNNQNTNNSSNSNFDNDEEEYEDTTITFSYNELKNKTEEELVKLFKEKGLVPKVNKETREVPYVDELADTTVITNSGYGSYEKGETVEIKATYYKPVAWKTYVSASVSGKSFNVKGKTCYTEQLYVNHDVDVAYCFYENPLGLNSYEINRIGRGVEFYINGKLIEKGSSLFKEYTFDKVETITFKVVAPYVYEFNLEGLDERGEGTMIDKNVTLYEKKINVKDLYSGEGEKAKIEIN